MTRPPLKTSRQTARPVSWLRPASAGGHLDTRGARPSNVGGPRTRYTGSVIYFFRRGTAALTWETRLNADGHRYDLVVTQAGESHVETFDTVAAMLAREHELVQAWRALGWQDLGTGRSAGARRGA